MKYLSYSHIKCTSVNTGFVTPVAQMCTSQTFQPSQDNTCKPHPQETPPCKASHQHIIMAVSLTRAISKRLHLLTKCTAATVSNTLGSVSKSLQVGLRRDEILKYR